MHIIIYGDPGGGFHYVGPFDNEDDAITYAEHDGERNRDWWLSDIAAPAGEEAEENTRTYIVTAAYADGDVYETTVQARDADEAEALAQQQVRIDGREGQPANVWPMPLMPLVDVHARPVEVGSRITITVELAIAVGKIAAAHPKCAVHIEYRESDPVELWHVIALDATDGDTEYVVNDESGRVVA